MQFVKCPSGYKAVIQEFISSYKIIANTHVINDVPGLEMVCVPADRGWLVVSLDL